MRYVRSITKLLIKLNIGYLFTRFNLFYISKTPLSKNFGFDLGNPVDRYYIEKFLNVNSDTIKGNVLEVAEATYTHKYGQDNVTQSDILHVDKEHQDATIIGDLVTGEGIPQNKFDCMILTQTFPFIYDHETAIRNSYNALKNEGVLLSTFAGISQISRHDMDHWGEYWRFTTLSAKLMFEKIFGKGNVEVVAYGNVKSACAFLQGIPTECLRINDLEFSDPDYELIIGVKATKR